VLRTLGQGSGGDGCEDVAFGFWCIVVKRRTGGEAKKEGELGSGGMYGIQPYGTIRYETVDDTHQHYTANQV